MPPRKSRNLSSSEDESIEVKPPSKRSKDNSADGGDLEGSEPKNKKSKTTTTTGDTNREVEVETNEDGDSFFKLSEARRLTVRTFKGKILVDIRETYKDKTSGQVKYGNKGISLNKEQWDVLKNNIDNVDDMIAQVNEK
ncbi:hypothetical protein I302_105744 [Kwoniella bestiolae CBS 10118]|uniref:Transcriptional coactivator p15 (PC4) C-terminal domain-containing protein n=1 Tax=Kwoniella bestiolae CBS 10118 TaxID=1296100 RepID=A0A1B9G210_9TREE|nr:hypothetical protein I302_04864 [Kwoniella bestiolae CBS 10118]OCF25054.1 hypothetical protein I302_04864 [Kwoniella bestiolae CBS 10118]